MIACSVLRRPPSQRIPVSTHARLIHASVSVASTVKKSVICHTHDVLPQSIEAMHVVLYRPRRFFLG